MYRVEIWKGPLYLNGRRHLAVCDHTDRRIIVSQCRQDSELDRLEAVARAVRLEAKATRYLEDVGAPISAIRSEAEEGNDTSSRLGE